MIDSISIQRIELLHPKIKDEVMALYFKAQALMPEGITIRIVQGVRTFPEQHSLYLQRPRVTKADAGQSYHNYGLAIDFCLMKDGKLIWEVNDNWMKVVHVFKDAGYEWGGDWKFKDNPHLQKVFGLNWRDLLIKYNKHDFIPGTEFVNI